MRIVGLILLAASLAGCTAGGSFCSVAKPNRFSSATISVMTDKEVEDALAHNRKGARLCGWKP